MHYSRHRLTTSLTYLTIRLRTRQPMTSELALLAHWSVRQKLNRVSSVQFSYVALWAPKVFITVQNVVPTRVVATKSSPAHASCASDRRLLSAGWWQTERYSSRVPDLRRPQALLAPACCQRQRNDESPADLGCLRSFVSLAPITYSA